jgi:aromatic-L-amino-acid/L-tryptophan decarboxylase
VDLDRDPLGSSKEAMRDIRYRTVDLLVEQLTDPGIPAMRRGSGDELRRRLMAPAPEQPRPWDELLAQLGDDVLGPMSRLAHPGYFAFIPASSTFAGALGDLIAAALDIDVGSWMAAAGPSQLELVVLDWFKSWIGYPPEAEGILVSGGSAANITALACARESLVGAGSDRAVAYVADQTHSSVARAARLIGFRPDQLRVLPTDDDHRLRVDALAGAVEADRQAGLQPLIVVANAGATNTGAVDPLHSLADLCREQGMWLHVDAAYGGFASLSERGRRELAGIARADSVTLDPHSEEVGSARADVAGFAGHRLLPAPVRRRARRGSDRAAQFGAGAGLRGDRTRPAVIDQAAWPVRDPAVRHEPHDWAGGRRSGAVVVRHGSGTAAPDDRVCRAV